MKKQYTNPTMEVVMMKMQGHLLEGSQFEISSESQDNEDALAPEFIYIDF